MLLTIFTGVEVLFFVLGVISTLLVLGFVLLNKQYQLDWKSWTVMVFGALLLVFSIAWSVSSVLEGEPRAASMGMVFFGIPGLGSYTIDAIRSQDFAIVRAMVFLGSVLYIIGLVLTDLSYTLVDPRVRLS